MQTNYLLHTVQLDFAIFHKTRRPRVVGELEEHADHRSDAGRDPGHRPLLPDPAAEIHSSDLRRVVACPIGLPKKFDVGREKIPELDLGRVRVLHKQIFELSLKFNELPRGFKPRQHEFLDQLVVPVGVLWNEKIHYLVDGRKFSSSFLDLLVKRSLFTIRVLVPSERARSEGRGVASADETGIVDPEK